MTIAWAQAVKELLTDYSLDVLLKIAGLPKSTYYWAIKHAQDDPNSEVKAEIKEIFNENKERYGVRRVYIVLTDAEGKYKRMISHGKVQRLMHEMGLKVKIRRAKYNSYKGTVGKIAPNIISRNFKALAPNMKWGTDVTEFKCSWGKHIYHP